MAPSPKKTARATRKPNKQDKVQLGMTLTINISNIASQESQKLFEDTPPVHEEPKFLVPPGTEGGPPPNTPYVSAKASMWGLGSFNSPFTKVVRNIMPNILTPASARTPADFHPPPKSPVIDPSLSENNPSPARKRERAVRFTATSKFSEISHSKDSDEDNYELAVDLLAGGEETDNENEKGGVDARDGGGDGDDGGDADADAGVLPVVEEMGKGKSYISTQIDWFLMYL